MSINTNIDGSSVGGANQLLDLLSIVSNPQVYENKVKALQNAIDENKKYVEAVAPVSEILAIREQIQEEKAAAVTALAEAKVKAADMVAQAKDKAAVLVADAEAKASQISSDVQAIAEEAKTARAEAQKAANETKKAKAEYDNLNTSLNTQLAQLAKTQADAEAARKEAEKLKQEIIVKHKAFIESL